MANKIWLWLSKPIVVYDFSEDTQRNRIIIRRTKMIISGLANLAIMGLGIWFAWWEFGFDVFKAPLFWFIIAVLFYSSVAMLAMRWEVATEKTTDEKVAALTTKFNELLIEIKGLREDVRNSGCKYPDTKL